jgi:hypothetical protein
LVEKWIPPTRSETVETGKKRERILGVKLKFGGGNLFSPAMTSTIEGNNSVGSLLEPLVKKVNPVVGSRMLCGANQPKSHHKLHKVDIQYWE